MQESAQRFGKNSEEITWNDQKDYKRNRSIYSDNTDDGIHADDGVYADDGIYADDGVYADVTLIMRLLVVGVVVLVSAWIFYLYQFYCQYSDCEH